jgi:anti-sigma factor RsiW
MSDAPQQPSDVHSIALLLPWYLSGRLSEPERREVEGHLTGCAACKDELASLSEMRRQSRDIIMGAPGPSPRVKHVVMSRVRNWRPRPRFLDRVASAAVELLRPKWAPSLAVLLIIGQFGALAWLTTRPGAQLELTSRSVAAVGVRLKIVFSPAATERDVRSAIRDLAGKIVDGPTDDGAYIVQISGASPQLVAAKLRTLRERPGLVERIDNAAP